MKKIPRIEYLLFAEAWVLLAFARSMLVIRPFKKIAQLLGKEMYEAPDDISENGLQRQKQVLVAVLRACRFSPWRTKCFEQAIAAKVMLKRRGIKSTVFFGVFKGESNELLAHAWLISNGMIVTGGPKIDQYTVLSWFGS
jgi:hypothetical protein